MAQLCVYCGNRVVWSEVLDTDEGAYASRLADTFGMEALTERRQIILMGMVCAECADQDHDACVHVAMHMISSALGC